MEVRHCFAVALLAAGEFLSGYYGLRTGSALATPEPLDDNQGAPTETKHMRLTSVASFLVAAVVSVASAAEAFAASALTNDYPTSARSEYVFACMKASGETRETLEQCSCSIDVIASLLPYDAYVAAETVASMNQALGQIGAVFRGALAELRRAQAEAEVRCF
jgi:hypothetical protein